MIFCPASTTTYSLHILKVWNKQGCLCLFTFLLVGEVEKAAQCTGTYLYLNPGQEDMVGNEVYYKEVEGVKEKWFLPREEAVAYVERDQDEEALLDFIENNYIFDKVEDEEDSETEIVEETSDLDADEFIAKV